MVATWGVVLAAGAGRRFGGRKQFSLLGGSRLVDHSVALAGAICDRICVVLPSGVDWDGAPVDLVRVGGETHAESTRSAIAALPDRPARVLITGPSHPLASIALGRSVLDAIAGGADGAAPVFPIVDAVRAITGSGGLRPVTHDGELVALQLPFAFDLDILRRAVSTPGEFVEEIGAVERVGGAIATVPGDPANLHIATADDLVVAEEILAGRDSRKSH